MREPRTSSRPPMFGRPLELSANCDICGKGRSNGRHAGCSRARQRKWAAEWAVRTAQGGQRHVH